MARKSKINTDFGSNVFTESQFSDAVHLVHNSIVANSGDFPGLPVTMIALDTEINAYDVILNAVAYPSQAADLDTQRIIVQAQITANGNFINNLANGNLSLLEKSGYPIAKSAQPQGILDQTILRVTVVNTAGELEYEISKVKGGSLKYAMLYTLASNTETNPFNWTYFYCAGKRKGTIKNLTSRLDYKFVSMAMGTDLTLVFSEIMVRAAQ